MRKRGAKHSTVAIKPLGMKGSKYEMDARAALVALKHDCANQQHLVDLYVLAELCEKLNDEIIGGEPHIKTHCNSVKRMCQAIHDADYRGGGLAATSMTASVDVLLRWFLGRPNSKVFHIAMRMVERMAA